MFGRGKGGSPPEWLLRVHSRGEGEMRPDSYPFPLSSFGACTVVTTRLGFWRKKIRRAEGVAAWEGRLKREPLYARGTWHPRVSARPLRTEGTTGCRWVVPLHGHQTAGAFTHMRQLGRTGYVCRQVRTPIPGFSAAQDAHL